VLDLYYKHPTLMARMRTGALGDYVDRFAAWLAERDYKRDTAATYLRYAAWLGRWLDETGRVLEALDEGLIAQFMIAVPDLPYVNATNTGKNSEILTSMRLVLRRLRADGLVKTQPPPPRAVPALIESFERWMVVHRGVLERTMRKDYRPVLRRVVDAIGDDPAAYTAATIRAFILDWAAAAGRHQVFVRLTVVRTFLRYLAITGHCRPELVGAVPRLAPWRFTSLPKWISADEVDRIVDSCDATRPLGLRDRAILMLLSRLGLRAVDAARLRLEDIDWAGARLWVSAKTRRREALPLPQDVGDALLAYIVDGRPTVSDGEVFIGARAPHAPLGADSVAAVVVRAAARAGVKTPKVGSHVLRHSLATALLAEGVSLEGIGAVLRHRDLDSTRIYAKVDVGTLATVARPWPLEVSP
jgi:integrase/recombinase XerD